MQLQWLIQALLLSVFHLPAICGTPVQFPNSQVSSDARALRGEPEAEPRIIHRQIKRLLLSCLLGRKRRSAEDYPQAQGRFFFPVIQSTNVHVNSGGGGGRPSYVTGGGSHCNIPGGLGSFPQAPAFPALPSLPSIPSLPSPSAPPDGDDNDDDDDDDTDDNSNVIPVTEENNEKRRRRPTTYNINRYFRPLYREVRRFTRLF